ncbi:PaaX family transcriptional regulator C-terminal domain-containing protein [Alloalcanivorax gelatiniphagus]|nr:PaaX family transcriptional regulator C-terminal domain-containing protein [Alloalcanivorax gelatiniphagus]
MSATDMVMDLLSTHDRHELSVAALCHAGELCDLRAQNVRVALNRLQRQGRVVSPERGLYRLDTATSGLFGEVESWLRREQRVRDWTGGWAAVLDSAVPRRDKTAWRRHERALALRGFRLLGDTGLRLRPDNLSGGIAGLRKDLARLGLAQEARVFAVTELSSADEKQARRLWDCSALKQQYRHMARQLAASHKTLTRRPESEVAAESLLLGRAAIRLILLDPLLPDTLIDNRPRHQLIERMGAYQRDAKAIWMAILNRI